MGVTVDHYLRRIGLALPIGIDAEGLRALQRAHLFTVPFENLDIHQGVPIVLDEEALLEKIVAHRRGGFCYELNGAFAWLLRELGFDVEFLSAQVFGRAGWGIEFDHMLLHVRLDEPWLADVGFGDNFIDPLRWVESAVQQQEVGAFRLDRSEPHWILMRSADPAGAYEKQYRFEARHHALTDFEPGCTFHQSAESHFSEATLCSLARLHGRITLRPERLIEAEGGERTETPISSADQWRSTLRDRFGIEPDRRSAAPEA